jgi:NADP-dependent 3-hydroxy acid dehydrogenase YdfG
LSSELADRRVLVTGGSSGIGLATARLLGSAGADVMIVARKKARLAASGFASARCLAADVSSETDVERLVEAVRGVWSGAPDVVVNSAGTFELAPLRETTLESFDHHLAVNLRGVFLQIRSWLAEMLERRSGHFVTIGSVAGRTAFPANGAYAASKFGVRGLHEVLDVELRGTGVRATLIEAAATDTALWSPIDRNKDPDLPGVAAMLQPQAVAQAVLYAVTQPPEVAVPVVGVERS